MSDYRPVRVSAGLDRRTFLKGVGLAGACLSVPGLTACGSEGDGARSKDPEQGPVTFGINANAAVPTDGYDNVFKAFTQRSGKQVRPNKLLYTEQINNYLTAAPDDLLIWNAGYRMRFFAAKD